MFQIYRVLGRKGRITIPLELRERVGFSSNDILSFTQQDDSTIIVRKEKICSHCAEGKSRKNTNDSILEFLSELSEEQKRMALVHLSVDWAEKQGGNLNVGNKSNL